MEDLTWTPEDRIRIASSILIRSIGTEGIRLAYIVLNAETEFLSANYHNFARFIAEKSPHKTKRRNTQKPRVTVVPLTLQSKTANVVYGCATSWGARDHMTIDEAVTLCGREVYGTPWALERNTFRYCLHCRAALKNK